MWGAIAGAAAPIIGGLIGQNQAQGARNNAEDDAKSALAAYQNINLPDVEKMRLALEQYQNMGSLAPTMEGASTLGDTALSNIQQDPKYNEYTMAALQKMAGVADRGLPEADRAQLQQILNSTANQNQAQQKQILENQAARGMGGSGNELAAQLSASQAGRNTASNEALQLAALAAQRKLDATSGLANMVNTAQNADYQRQSNLQGQRDAISQFNASQQQGVTTRNVGAQNNAALRNLENQQNISNSNTNLRNQQQQHNRGLEQQNFNNQITRAGGVAQGYNNMANLNNAQANATAGMYSQIGSGIGGMVGAMGSPAPTNGAPGIVGDQSIANGEVGIRSGTGFRK